MTPVCWVMTMGHGDSTYNKDSFGKLPLVFWVGFKGNSRDSFGKLSLVFCVGFKGNSRNCFGKLPCVLGWFKGKLKGQLWQVHLCVGLVQRELKGQCWEVTLCFGLVQRNIERTVLGSSLVLWVGSKGIKKDSFRKFPCVLGWFEGKLKEQCWEALFCFGLVQREIKGTALRSSPLFWVGLKRN